MLNIFKKRKPVTHDYSLEKRGFGHDFIFTPMYKGLKGIATGWGTGIKTGDYLLLGHKGGTARYKVESIKYYLDPPDMWSANLVYEKLTT